MHRDLAPVLADAIRPQLAAVTAGRYVDVAVDPATLEVRAKESPELGGRWRAADYLRVGPTNRSTCSSERRWLSIS